MTGVDVDPHDRWFPLDLEGDVDSAVERRVRDYAAEGADDEQVAGSVALLAGLARRVRAVAEQADLAGVGTLAAWTLLPEEPLLVPGPVATLRVMSLAPTESLDEVVLRLVAPPEERHGPLHVEDLDTESGPGLHVRARPVTGGDGQRVVHEERLVLWELRAMDAAIVLSCVTTDLVAGGLADGPFRELARGVRIT